MECSFAELSPCKKKFMDTHFIVQLVFTLLISEAHPPVFMVYFTIQNRILEVQAWKIGFP